MLANPDEGEVAIRWPSMPGGYVVGCLGARAIRWVEESTGRSIDQIFVGFVRSIEAQSMAGIRYTDATAIVWAAVEHHRRVVGRSTEVTLDDVDALVDEIGRDDLYAYAYNLLHWSVSNRTKRHQMEAEAEAAGMGDAVGELRAVASGTGIDTSPPGSSPESTSTPSGG